MYEKIIFNFFATIVIFVGIVISVMSQNKLLGIVFLFWFIFFTLISYFLAEYKTKFDEDVASHGSVVQSYFADVFSNIITVKNFAGRAFEFKNFSRLTEENKEKRKRAWYLGNFQTTTQSVLVLFLEVLGLYLAIDMWTKGQVSGGFVVMLQMYMFTIVEYTWNIGDSIKSFATALASAKEMVEIFEAPIDIEDPVKPEKCKIKDGNIVFDNITFEYKDGKDVFKKFKLEIPAGQKVGFVGHSGSGKTTITNLLLRFEDVQAGAIKIDGQDIRNITQDDLRRNISYVPQEPALFHRSLQENIMYGNPKASKLAMLEASKKAHADEFIREFKDGYDTLVGERGVKLSGGQRQRVAIARVMLKDAPILVLDEATSSLDSISENLIQSAFDEAMNGRTTLVIAHRLSTVKKMDRIIVLEKGKIVEDGGHEELLAKGGHYFKLWQAQKDGVI